MFLGIDCSTQSLKLQVINEFKRLEKEVVVIYDEDLPHYKTVNGIIRHNTNDFEHISTPTVLFIEALELAVNKLKLQFDLSKIKAISGSGQQHGSVWWKKNSRNLLKKINTGDSNQETLFKLLENSFALPMSPIWMDASTTAECKSITEQIGSSGKLAEVTGSRAYERFTGPQIKHLYKHQPDVYENTERISLISSFLPSLFIGDYSPIDLSDGSGMNLLDIHNYSWNQQLLDIVAPNLREKLGEPVASKSKVGLISQYWCSKYGFSSECIVFAFSGDNPCSLVGLNLNKAGDVGISLGTSDVLFAVTNDPKPSADEGSILIHPQDIKNYMMMLVYKNGATTRKHVRDSIHSDDNKWANFNQSILNTPVGNNGNLAFYYIETEITPNISVSGKIVRYNENDEINEASLNASDCRGIIESQVLSYKHHAKKLGLNEISSIIVTGGGSQNKEILQIIADVFEMDVVASSITNTAASGAAIRALVAYSELNGLKASSSEVESSVKSNEVTKPIPSHFPIYRKLFARYGNLEAKTVEILNKN